MGRQAKMTIIPSIVYMNHCRQLNKRERERDREGEGETETDIERDRDRERERERERERGREGEGLNRPSELSKHHLISLFPNRGSKNPLRSSPGEVRPC
jgi:hypothetical protein